MNEAPEDAYDESSDKLIGQTLANRYRIETRLGEGAMGAVYRAKHIKVGRPFAVKVLHLHLLREDKIVQRFEREAELAGRLHHPNVIGVVDVGELPDGTRYMVMDFAEGKDLATLFADAPFPPPRIIHLTRQLLEGLYHAHEQGLIHRDFKPENVIVERDNHDAEVPRIVDFGIAILREGGDSTSGPGRLTTNGLVLGTPHYMAPEQAVADPIDHRIDLFALGIMIYEMLSGKLPFDGSGAEVARANLLLDPPRISDRVPYLEVDPLLEAFARLLMAKKRDVRPATAKVARELLDLIERDREAAAAALGVPLDTARLPMTTQPVSPVTDDGSGRAIQTPRQAPAMSKPVAVAHAHSNERAIETEPTRLVTSWESRRGTWLVTGAVMLAICGVGVAFALRGSSNEPPAAPAIVSTVAPAAQPTTAQPTTVNTQVPTAARASPPAPTAADGAAPPPTPAPMPTPPISAPAGTQHAPSVAKLSRRDVTSKAAATPVVVAPTPPPQANSVAETAPVATPAAAVAKPAAPTAPQTLDASGFAALYRAVGGELKAFEQKKGGDAASDLWSRYRMIRFSNAISSQANRDEAAATLAKIRADLAKLR